MNKKEKLSLVFDFISDYLINENNVNNTEFKVDEKMGRAHDIMKKMDEIDNVDSRLKSELKEKMNSIRTNHHTDLKDSEEKVMEEIANKSLNKSFKERTGVTLDKYGKISSVEVGPLKEYTTISEVMNKINN
jgi:hypothetical protein